MKSKFLFILLLFPYFSFSQKLSMVGSNFSFAKGNIDVEVLTEIVQQKQDEVMERVFRNMVIGNLKNDYGAEKSFTTYSYIYNTLQTLTVEKNKTVITRQIINNIFEYSLVYGFTRDFINSNRLGQINIPKVEATANKDITISSLSLINKLEELKTKDNQKGFLKENDTEGWMTFNILLDMAFDIFLQDKSINSLHNNGLFKLLIEKPTLESWYNKDNAYLKVKNDPQIKAYRGIMQTAYDQFKVKTFGGVELINVYSELEKTDFKQETITETQYLAVKILLRNAIKTLKLYSNNNIIGNISEFLLDYTLIEFAPPTGQSGLGEQKPLTPNQRGILYIDAEGLISSLYDKYASNNKRSSVSNALYFITPRPFLIIGATHSGAISNNNQLVIDENGSTSNLNNIYFANEKIGLKFTFIDRKYTHSFEPGEEFKYHGEKRYWKFPQEEPLISRTELMIYGSGLLYNIVDIKSQQNFNYTLIGSSFGITFFNGLMLNAGAALPVNARDDLSKKFLYTLSFDVPIIEYITTVRKKRNL